MTSSSDDRSTQTADDILDRVALGIFEAESDFHVIDGAAPLPDRHFKVAIALYRCMAREAIAIIRQVDAGK